MAGPKIMLRDFWLGALNALTLGHLDRWAGRRAARRKVAGLARHA